MRLSVNSLVISYSDMKILVTGATGFVGKTVVKQLIASNEFCVALLVRQPNLASTLFGESVELIVSGNSMREKIIEFNPDLVLHLAAFISNASDTETVNQLVDSNILFTTKLLEALSATDCSFFINVGSFLESVNVNGSVSPSNLYAATKAACRPILQYFKEIYQWKWVNVILYTPYGRVNRRKKVIDYMIEALDSTEPIPFTNGYQVLDFIHVDDIARFFYLLLKQVSNLPNDFIEFQLGSGVGYDIREIANIIEDISGKKVNADWGRLPYDKINPMRSVAQIALAKDVLGWTPEIDIQSGIKILLEENAILKTK